MAASSTRPISANQPPMGVVTPGSTPVERLGPGGGERDGAAVGTDGMFLPPRRAVRSSAIPALPMVGTGCRADAAVCSSWTCFFRGHRGWVRTTRMRGVRRHVDRTRPAGCAVGDAEGSQTYLRGGLQSGRHSRVPICPARSGSSRGGGDAFNKWMLRPASKPRQSGGAALSGARLRHRAGSSAVPAWASTTARLTPAGAARQLPEPAWAIFDR